MAVKNPKSKIQNPKSSRETKLPKEIFGVEPNTTLLHQVITGYLSNKIKSTAHTKTRGEVSGGGRKPWRQKGTGRARAGSIRSPLWIGGGIVFGPTSQKNYKKALPQRIRLQALAQALTDRYRNKVLQIVPSFPFEKPNTKQALAFAKKLSLEGKTLFVSSGPNRNLFKSVANVPEFDSTSASNVNALDVLLNKNIVVEKPAIAELMKRFKLSP